jgi:hypothetical protein
MIHVFQVELLYHDLKDVKKITGDQLEPDDEHTDERINVTTF